MGQYRSNKLKYLGGKECRSSEVHKTFYGSCVWLRKHNINERDKNMLRFFKVSEKAFNNIYVLMAIILILWGNFAAVSKMALNSLDSLQVQFYMFGLAFICMTGFCIRNGKFKELRSLHRREVIRLIGYSIPSFLYYVFYLMSLQLIPAVEASMLNYSFPIMIV